MQAKVMVLNAVSVAAFLSLALPALAAPAGVEQLVAQAPAQQTPANPFKDAKAPDAPGFPGKGDSKLWMKGAKVFNEAIDLSSSKKYKEAITKYKEAIKIYPYAPVWYANMAFAMERSGDPAGGVEACKKAIELDKTEAGAYENMGNCYYDLGKYTESRDAFNKCLGCELTLRKRDELLGVIKQLTAMIEKK